MENKREKINYAVAEAAALGLPVKVEGVEVHACPHCHGAGMIPTSQPLRVPKRLREMHCRSEHLVPICVGVTVCNPCDGEGHSEKTPTLTVQQG